MCFFWVLCECFFLFVKVGEVFIVRNFIFINICYSVCCQIVHMRLVLLLLYLFCVVIINAHIKSIIEHSKYNKYIVLLSLILIKNKIKYYETKHYSSCHLTFFYECHGFGPYHLCITSGQ